MGFDPITLGIGAAYAGGKYLSNRGKKKKADTALNTYGKPDERVNQMYDDAASRLPGARERDAQLRDNIMNQYQNQANGGSNVSFNTRALPTYEEFARTGGWGAADTAGINRTIGGYEDLAAGKGPAQEFYRNLMDTGGYTDADKSNIRGRIASNTPAIYESLRGDMERMSAPQGYRPGFSDSLARLAREKARESGAAVREGEIGLSESIRGGRLAGAGGYSSNVLAGLGGAASTRMGYVNSRNQGRLAGAGGMNDISRGEMDADQFNTQQRNRALEGMTQLRGQRSAEEAMYLDQMMASLGMNAQQRQAFLSQTMGNEANKGAMDDDLMQDSLGFLLAARKKPDDDYEDEPKQLQSKYRNYGGF